MPRNQYAQDVVLPEYRKPKSSPVREEFSAPPSLNDVITAPPTFVDLKRGISLNDRFLFQRELFGNDPQKDERSDTHAGYLYDLRGGRGVCASDLPLGF